MNKSCPICEGIGWVRENHPDQPWQGPHACTCGGAGAPCPRCNTGTIALTGACSDREALPRAL